MTREEYETGIARILVERHGFGAEAAREEAVGALTAFLSDEKIEYGHPGYTWDDPRDIVNECIAPYLEG